MKPKIALILAMIMLTSIIAVPQGATATPVGAPPTAPSIVRFAQFNASVNRNAAGQLLADLSTPNNVQAKTVAEIIQRTNPDVLLINEFDYYEDHAVADLFRQNYLEVGQNGASPVVYPYVYVAPSNTGIASGFDLNNNGEIVTTPGAPGYGDDALGFGVFPGQFGMALFSKYPIDVRKVRTFQKFLWKDMPGALLPDDPATPAPDDWYSPEELAIFRLSSKSHWDVPIMIGDQTIHVLASHPTPPVFDGAEDRNGRRNHDEIRFWSDYVTPTRGDYIYDDRGRRGGLAAGERFVIMGDQNADPEDGDSFDNAILQLLDNPLINTTVTPTSPGGPQQAALQGLANATHDGDPAFDTADFADFGTNPGNLRADYVLPSVRLPIVDAAVFWPENTDPLFPLVGVFPFPSSDHRLVWVDVESIPEVKPVRETQTVYDADEPPPGGRFGDADDPAIWLNPRNPSASLIISALKDGGLDVYTLSGAALQEIAPDDVRYNNADVQYGFPLGGEFVDIAVATDRRNDLLAIFTIDPRSRRLSDVTDPNSPLIFTPAGEESNGTTTAYGLALYRSPVSGRYYAFVTQRDSNVVAQLELFDSGAGTIGWRTVRTLTLPFDGDLEDAQSEGMVADNELGILYVAQENAGIWKFAAEPDASSIGTLIEAVFPDGDILKADAEGLTIYYGPGGTGYLLASSQGDSTFAVFTREGDNDYIGRFAVGRNGRIDPSEESDGAAVISTSLGGQFRHGLLVVHDGLNDPPFFVEDDGEIENAATNFKFVRWEDVAHPLGLMVDTGYDPRAPRPSTLPNGVASGDVSQTTAVLWARSTALGRMRIDVSTAEIFSHFDCVKFVEVTDPTAPVKILIDQLTPDTHYYFRVRDAAGTVVRGEFRTAAPAGKQRGLRFGVSGDWRGELSPYPAIANADERGLEFFVLHGDTVYADFASPAVPKDQAETLDEYRAKHAEVYGTRFGLNTFAELRATVPMLATIDDHEVTNDFSGGAPCSSDPRFSCPTPETLINDSPLYETGMQAFQEYNPIADEFYGDAGDPRTDGERKLYRFRTYGDDAAVFVLDSRSFRDVPLPPVADLADPAQVGAYLAASFNPARTFLGRQQVEDLKTDLLSAQQAGITWKFVMVPEPIQNLGVLGASDRFEGYAAERTEILKFIDDNDITNVIFVAADIHGTLVNDVTYQLGPFQPQIATGAFEITTGSVAFDEPFGPTIAQLAADVGLLSPQQLAFYNSLPVAGDADSIPNDKDDFLTLLIDESITALGYNPLGLAGSDVDATLLRGDYAALHTFGWTEFDIDRVTRQLRVTTYGIAPYSQAELFADPAAVTGRTPQVVSEFTVDPQP